MLNHFGIQIVGVHLIVTIKLYVLHHKNRILLILFLNLILDKLFLKYLFRFPSQLANFIGKK